MRTPGFGFNTRLKSPSATTAMMWPMDLADHDAGRKCFASRITLYLYKDNYRRCHTQSLPHMIATLLFILYSVQLTKMNSLHNEKLQWVGDGSEGSKLTTSGNSVEMEGKSRGTPFNVRLKSDKLDEAYYIGVEIKKLVGNFSLGAVREDEFKPGWKTKGLFYNVSL